MKKIKEILFLCVLVSFCILLGYELVDKLSVKGTVQAPEVSDIF